MNEKGFRFGDDKISPSDLGVGSRLEALLFSLYDDGIDELEGVDFEIPVANKKIVSKINLMINLQNQLSSIESKN